MAKPRIKHIAIMCSDPDNLAKFYCDVFAMEVQHRKGNESVFLTDGYMNIALLSQKAEGKPNGLNHIGFHVEDPDAIAASMTKWKAVAPKKRPPDRHYAETRGADPEGNNFDLSRGGFERVRADRKDE